MKHTTHPTFIRSTLSLAVCLSSVAVPAMASELAVLEKIDLGTLKADNSGWSAVHALSADGKMVGGEARNDRNDRRAVIWSGENYATKADLGTLDKDNSGISSVEAISTDGKVVAGRAMLTPNRPAMTTGSDPRDPANLGVTYSHATIWSGKSHATKTDLGTLRADNSGEAGIRALSADGKVAGGESEYDKAVVFRAKHATINRFGHIKGGQLRAVRSLCPK